MRDGRRWVMSTTTRVLLVPGMPLRLADQDKTNGAVSRSRRVSPVPRRLVSESVSRPAAWPAGFFSFAVLLVAAIPWLWLLCPGSRNDRVAGLALTRQTRPRSWCSEEDAARSPDHYRVKVPVEAFQEHHKRCDLRRGVAGFHRASPTYPGCPARSLGPP
jgi:hypothetical protein